MTRRLTLLSLLLLSSLLGAQQTKIVPAMAASAGNSRSFPPFVVDAGLMQQLIDGKALSIRSSLLRGIAYRKDAPSAAYQGRTIPVLKLRLGMSKRTPATMSTTFAKNRTSRMVTAFSGSFNLPTQKNTPGLRPFNIVLPFANPFAYVNFNGNLLIELEMPGNAKTKFFYALDGWVSGTPGSHRAFGTNGRLMAGDRWNVFSSLDQLRPGGEAIVSVVNLTRVRPAFAIYGISNTKFGGFTLPLNLTPFGAPGNFLYVSADVVFPVPLRMITPTLFTARAVAALPDDPSLSGKKIFGQIVLLDAPSNALGVVSSRGVEMTLGGGVTAPLQTLHGLDTGLAYGGFVNPGRTGGPVIQLRGAFN